MNLYKLSNTNDSYLWTCEILSVLYTAMEEWNLRCGNSEFLGAILNISFYRIYNEFDEIDMMDKNLYVLGKDTVKMIT